LLRFVAAAGTEIFSINNSAMLYVEMTIFFCVAAGDGSVGGGGGG
jgi:hypothetical protein